MRIPVKSSVGEGAALLFRRGRGRRRGRRSWAENVTRPSRVPVPGFGGGAVCLTGGGLMPVKAVNSMLE